MKTRTSLVLILALSFLTSADGQKASPAPQQSVPDPDEVVRISTNLVQLDAIVTDKSDKPVTGLGPKDFEILEDGRPQAITNFSYVSIEPLSGPAVSPAAPSASQPRAPSVTLPSEQVRRTIVLVVDDLGMAFDDVRFVQRALRKFVDEQLQPGDLVGIVMTGGGALQPFTPDRRQLYAAIERVRWTRPGRVGVTLNSDLKSLDPTLLGKTIGTLNAIVTGMKGLPGRKSVLFFTDDFPIFKKEISRPINLRPSLQDMDKMVEDLEQRAIEIEQGAIELNENVGLALGQYPDRVAELIDHANQASVVIYTVDTRGLQTLNQTADERGKDTFTPQNFEDLRDNARAKLLETQYGLGYLARQTSGFLISNSNDISRGIQRVLDDQKGYYLIGYRPPEETFKSNAGRFHRVEVRVKRSDLRVRSRKGFYSLSEENKPPLVKLARNEQLRLALASPFASTGVGLRSTAVFGNTKQSGSFIRLFLHINVHDLSFKEEADGSHSASIDVVAQAFSSEGISADTLARTETIRMQGKAYERALEEGLVYILNVPLKKPGAHQLRVAVRDVATERTGTVNQFVEVPDLTKNRLAVSGIAISGSIAPSALPTPQANTPATLILPNTARSVESDASALEMQSGPAVRRLRQGMLMNYGLVIYNAQVDAQTGRPQVQTQMRLFHDGKLVYEGASRPFDSSGQSDMQRLAFNGRLLLGTSLMPGEYMLQVVVTDALVKGQYSTATQWIDFEIVK